MSFWTEDRIAFVRENADRLSASAIADHLGCTRNAVIGKAGRLNISLSKSGIVPAPVVALAVPPKLGLAENPPRGKYAATRPEHFVTRCADCAALSGELSWGKKGQNAACIVLRRIGWTMRGANRHALWSCPSCPQVGAPLAPVPRPREVRALIVVEAPRPLVCDPVEPKEIWELRDCDCVWPLGDPMSDEFRYCAAPKADKRYCAAHAKLSRGSGTPSERTAHKPVKRMYLR